MLFTNSHRATYDSLLATGSLFFSRTKILPKLRLRLFPLLIGPTGVGKSYLVETAAREIGAHYLKITRGDWLVTGCKAGRSTVFQILDRVATFERVLLHFDELDKFGNLQGSEWSAAIASDVWNILDGKFQLTEYLRDTNFPDCEKPTEVQLAQRVRNILWIVGSGTWQTAFAESRAGGTVGFAGSQSPTVVDFGTIARTQQISPELLHRFGEPIFLTYPSRDETIRLLETTGIARLARHLHMEVSPEQIDWTQGGMRALETLATRLALAYCRQKKMVQEKLPFAEEDAKPTIPTGSRLNTL